MTDTNTTLTSGNDLRTITPITIEDVVPSPIGTFGEARFDDAVLVEAEWDDGSEVTDDELEEINKRFRDWVIGFAEESYIPSEEESYLEWEDERWPF